MSERKSGTCPSAPCAPGAQCSHAMACPGMPAHPRIHAWAWAWAWPWLTDPRTQTRSQTHAHKQGARQEPCDVIPTSYFLLPTSYFLLHTSYFLGRRTTRATARATLATARPLSSSCTRRLLASTGRVPTRTLYTWRRTASPSAPRLQRSTWTSRSSTAPPAPHQRLLMRASPWVSRVGRTWQTSRSSRSRCGASCEHDLT